jgi:hypothetical protein
MKRYRVVLASCLLASCLVSGCAARTTATAHQDITVGIASAGAAADAAEKEYQAKQIPQSDANRYAINALGNAYNEARAAFLVVLTAESVYRGSQSVQLAACAPGAAATDLKVNGAAVTCAAATANVTKAKAQLESDNAALSAKVAAMGASTSKVQGLVKKQ